MTFRKQTGRRWRAVLAGAAAACLLALSCARADEVVDVRLGELTLRVPKSWKQSPPTNNLRLGQFEVPAAAGDGEAAELTVFSFGGGGSTRANIDRWIGQFESDGRQVKTVSGKAAAGDYVLVDVTGTYKKPVGPPVAGKTEPLPNARMLGLILAVKDQGNYFLKLTGPTNTVTANAPAFRNSFGAAPDSEKDLPNE